MIAKLTLAIVTRKRPSKLHRCLTSIAEQTLAPGRILVVDNDRRESARRVTQLFKSKLPLVYVVEKIQNVPLARNKALSLCHAPFLGFIDDDCVLEKNWTEKGFQTLKKNPRVAYVEGQSRLLNKTNSLAQALFYRERFWFNYKLKPKTTTPYNLDTKNVIFRANLLKRQRITFDKHLYLAEVGDHADVDVGFQLEKLGLTGKYEPGMTLYHEEITTFRDFIKKAYERGRVGFLLYHKWRLAGELVFLPDIRWSKWFRRLKCWPKDYESWTREIPGNHFHKAVLFLLMKLYDRVYLQGFVDQARKAGVRLNLQEKRADS